MTTERLFKIFLNHGCTLKHYAKWKKIDTKEQVLDDSFMWSI